MRENELNVGKLRGGTVEYKACYRPRGIRSQFDDWFEHVWNQISATIVAKWMRVNDGLTLIELLHDWRERRVTEEFPLVIGHHAHAVKLERIKHVFYFT